MRVDRKYFHMPCPISRPVVAQLAKPLPKMPTFHIYTGPRPGCSTSHPTLDPDVVAQAFGSIHRYGSPRHSCRIVVSSWLAPDIVVLCHFWQFASTSVTLPNNINMPISGRRT